MKMSNAKHLRNATAGLSGREKWDNLFVKIVPEFLRGPAVLRQALQLPRATSQRCLSAGLGALRYMCCSPGMTTSMREQSTGCTIGKKRADNG